MDSVNSIQTTSAPSPRAVQSQSQASTPAPAVVNVAAPLSPRAVVDPVAGAVVMEYLSSTGELVEQYPSTVALAYLRSGLSAAGLPVRDATGAVQTEA